MPVPAPELCVVVPVLDERDNIGPLVERLRTVLDGIDWEAVFVDDGSDDGTRAAVADVGRGDARVRLVYRVGRRGLASAFVEGALCSLAPFVAAMDGDLQHDEALLPRMLELLRREPVDVVVGSRYVLGGDVGDWDRRRAGMSDLATRLARFVLRASIADPMSGFFMVRRSALDRALPRLSAIGFKILVDLLASMPEPPVVRELPYRFRPRAAGASKLDSGVVLDYALLLADKLVGRLVPVRFLLFAIIGALGLGWHLMVLAAGLDVGLGFEPAQALATAVAVVGNFTLNNLFTFSDRRLRGSRVLPGFIVFAAVCAVGAVGNLGVAGFVLGTGGERWWVAGLAGAGMSLVWNYAVGATLTWRRG